MGLTIFGVWRSGALRAGYLKGEGKPFHVTAPGIINAPRSTRQVCFWRRVALLTVYGEPCLWETWKVDSVTVVYREFHMEALSGSVWSCLYSPVNPVGMRS